MGRKSPLREREDALLQFEKYVRGAKREKKSWVYLFPCALPRDY